MHWRNTLFAIAIALIALGPFDKVTAADNTIQFEITGGIWQSGCGLISDVQTIDLGTYYVDQFRLPNQSSEPVKFTLKINDGCYFGKDLPTGILPNELPRARLVFEDISQGDGYTEYLDDALRTKSGIGVQVGFNSTTPLPFRNGSVAQMGIPEENYQGGTIGDPQYISFYAWMWSGPSPNPVAGNVEAAMTVKLEYY